MLTIKISCNTWAQITTRITTLHAQYPKQDPWRHSQCQAQDSHSSHDRWCRDWRSSLHQSPESWRLFWRSSTQTPFWTAQQRGSRRYNECVWLSAARLHFFRSHIQIQYQHESYELEASIRIFCSSQWARIWMLKLVRILKYLNGSMMTSMLMTG